ncbi:MAG: hypothetical protein D4R65_16005 [Verrucomicrobiaceae bacterium]|nr:MAG: hypothetical protein D4R65_16005 [Verrucomicrobiaceae bacterium]
MSLKTDTLNMRIAPTTKLALRDIGERENRSMVNALEWLVVEYFRTRGLPYPTADVKRGKNASRNHT